MVDAVYRSDSRRVLATLIRLLGDFDLAEEALHDAFTAAVERWPRDGAPANPRAWLVSAGRFKAIDAMRRRARFDASLEEIARRFDVETSDPVARDGESVEDDRLRLIFTCCHPALPPDAQIALTLREVCGLTTEEIARALLTGTRAVAQRRVRAQAEIRDARIPDEVPVRGDLPGRLAPHRHLIGNARVPNLCLGAHDALGHCGRTGEKGAGDLLGREAADLAQGQRDLRVRRQSRMAAGEDQPQPIVLDTLPVPCDGVACLNVKSAGDLRERR